MKMKRILALLCAAATLTLSCKKSSSDPAPGPENKDFTIEQTTLHRVPSAFASHLRTMKALTTSTSSPKRISPNCTAAIPTN